MFLAEKWSNFAHLFRGQRPVLMDVAPNDFDHCYNSQIKCWAHNKKAVSHPYLDLRASDLHSLFWSEGWWSRLSRENWVRYGHREYIKIVALTEPNYRALLYTTEKSESQIYIKFKFSNFRHGKNFFCFCICLCCTTDNCRKKRARPWNQTDFSRTKKKEFWGWVKH